MKFKILLFILFTSINLFAQKSFLEEIDFRSKYLNESRKVTIYLPENFNSKKKYNVIFCTDGQFINSDYQNKLDSLFTIKTVNPFVIIGAHSNEKDIPNTYFS
ncbi:alpha/beta hydrolase-fold protein [Empedobacter sedimenti]|uniref:alpha/beta hydrolase-fold protein n=1 Tax=Empedobacter sedimenti TaxID=3042610 RepID=UPI00387E3DC4